jgi:hypothetical protein
VQSGREGCGDHIAPLFTFIRVCVVHAVNDLCHDGDASTVVLRRVVIQVVELGLDKYLEVCEKVAESAAKEYTIEQTLDKMESDWLPFKLDIKSYRDTGTGVLAGFDEINALLDEQVQGHRYARSYRGDTMDREGHWKDPTGATTRGHRIDDHSPPPAAVSSEKNINDVVMHPPFGA